jgi:Ni,Fe-hydrogenase I cytochrome b subunit
MITAYDPLISWAWVQVVGILCLAILGYWIYQEFKKVDKEKRLKMASAWGLVLLTGIGVFLMINQNRETILVRLFPNYYQVDNISPEQQQKIEEILTP